MTAAFTIAAALAGPTGSRGRLIDVSMLESVIATMGWVVSNYLVAGKIPEPAGNDNFTASPSGSFHTGDGLINIAANKQEQFEALCQVVDWWRTEIIDIKPGEIRYRGYAIEELIGNVGFAEMI